MDTEDLTMKAVREAWLSMGRTDIDESTGEVAGDDCSQHQKVESTPPKISRKPSQIKLKPCKKIHQCTYCPASFKLSGNLKNHIRVHTGEKPFKCDICKKCFREGTQLKVHKRTHSGEKPYYCTECGRQFSHSSHLTRHMRTHTGEKPYTCTICLRKFAKLCTLKSHIAKIHADEV